MLKDVSSALGKVGKFSGFLSLFFAILSIGLIIYGGSMMSKNKNTYVKHLFTVVKVDYCNKQTHCSKSGCSSDYHCSLVVSYDSSVEGSETASLSTSSNNNYSKGDTLYAYYNKFNKKDVRQDNPYTLGTVLLCLGIFLFIVFILKFLCSRYKSCAKFLGGLFLLNLVRR